MPIQNYSVLKGDPTSGELVLNRGGGNPHYRIYIKAGDGAAQIDVNVESQDGSEVLYFNNVFTPPQEWWVALFIAFQPQSWETNNDGNPQITGSANQSR